MLLMDCPERSNTLKWKVEDRITTLMGNTTMWKKLTGGGAHKNKNETKGQWYNRSQKNKQVMGWEGIVNGAKCFMEVVKPV
jgi:hypothetical protein